MEVALISCKILESSYYGVTAAPPRSAALEAPKHWIFLMYGDPPRNGHSFVLNSQMAFCIRGPHSGP